MMLFAIPHWLAATFWGLVSGSALLIGALVGYFNRVSTEVLQSIPRKKFQVEMQ